MDNFLDEAFKKENNEIKVKKNYKNGVLTFSKKLIYTVVFVALCVVLSLFSKNNDSVEKAFMLMHIPVLLCGLICGGPFGFFAGAVAPIVSFFVFPQSTAFNSILCFVFELAVYGCVSGYLYKALPKKSLVVIPIVLISYCTAKIAEISTVYCISMFSGVKLDIINYLSDTVINNIPGLIIQIIAFPIIIALFKKFGMALNE